MYVCACTPMCACLHVCPHMWAHVSAYAFTYMCTRLHMCVVCTCGARLFARVCACVCVCVSARVHSCRHVSVCTHVCMCFCTCMCACMFVCACAWMCAHMAACVCTCMCVRVCACTECAPPSPHAEMTPPPPSLSAAPFISQRPHPLAFLLENHSPVPPVLSAQAGPWPHMQLCGWLLPVVLEPGWGLEGRRPATTWDCHRPRPWGPLSDGVPSVAGGCLRGGLWTGH